ncbi:hypothetical protein Tco_0966709 [Tanacetum coccineum]
MPLMSHHICNTSTLLCRGITEVVHSVFNSRDSDVDDSPVNDRFKIGEGFHAVPPPYTGNYMPSRPDLSFVGLDDSIYKTKVSEIETSISKTSKDIVEKTKTIRPIAPIIEEWDTNSDNDIVATKSGQVLVNVAKQSSPRAATSISTAKPVNTAAPKSKVNDALPITYYFFKAHSPVRKDFNQKSASKTNNFNEKVKTAKVKNVTTAGPKAVVSVVVGNRENAVKSSACWIWRPTGNIIDHTSIYNRSYMLRIFDYVDLQGRLKHRAKIVCHERVVRIPLPHGEMLRVYGERPEEKVKRFMSAKVEELKLKDIAIVRNFSEVFLDDLSGLPPSREVAFHIDLIPIAMPVAKSLYRLAPTKIEELSNQLRELSDKGFIRPSSSP